MNFNPPARNLPRIWCDFNACGWSGQPDDNCYYVVDLTAVSAHSLADGARLVLWDDEGEGQVICCEGQLELFNEKWRVRPVADTWFRGNLDRSSQ
ncbi:MAG: hypothetical protein JWM11_3996 [Planctomycetaceae bacterium]|nr:hypothetical protein [Planctomycetaceae bacterium]